MVIGDQWIHKPDIFHFSNRSICIMKKQTSEQFLHLLKKKLTQKMNSLRGSVCQIQTQLLTYFTLHFKQQTLSFIPGSTNNLPQRARNITDFTIICWGELIMY